MRCLAFDGPLFRLQLEVLCTIMSIPTCGSDGLSRDPSGSSSPGTEVSLSESLQEPTGQKSRADVKEQRKPSRMYRYK